MGDLNSKVRKKGDNKIVGKYRLGNAINADENGSNSARQSTK